MDRRRIGKIAESIDTVYRELARVTIGQLKGIPSALSSAEVLGSYPVVMSRATTDFLQESMRSATGPQDALRIERLRFGCAELRIEAETSPLAEMIDFFAQRGWMHVGSEKIPALGVVPWIQAQSDFDKREAMKKENSIFLKGIVNRPMAEILDITIRVVTEQFGFKDFVGFCETKKQVSFEDEAARYRKYLEDTAETYTRRIAPWVEEKIGRPFDNLSRYHALYLMRIGEFDRFFPRSALVETLRKTFAGLGFDLGTRPDIVMDIDDDSKKNPNGMCVGVEIPGEIHVLMKPVGGLIDVETLLHETGHAFFLSHFDPGLPVEFRRLYRSGALDETFAFLFMDLLDNPAWLTRIAGLAANEADRLVRLVGTKRLCLIRRYMGKFLSEKELHENGDLRDPQPYCRNMQNATGFVYEPAGYLVDMEPNFYSLDYLMAWAGANVLRGHLEDRFGEEWFTMPQAGDFLRQMAFSGRQDPLDQVLKNFCGETARLPDFSGD